MRVYAILFFAFSSLFLFTDCSKKYSADKLPQQQLRWGHGGGFVGQEITHTLLANGQAFKSMGYKAPFEATDGVKKREAKKIFKSFAKIDLTKLPESKPGNRYSFLDLPDGKGGFLRVAFEDETALPEALRNLHQQLNKIDFIPPVVKKEDQVH